MGGDSKMGIKRKNKNSFEFGASSSLHLQHLSICVHIGRNPKNIILNFRRRRAKIFENVKIKSTFS